MRSFLVRLGGVFFLGVAIVLAQMPVGSIVGTVQDPSGALVPGVKLTLRDVLTGATRETTSAAEGTYQFPQLRPSTYEITGESAGFRKVVVRDIVVNVGIVAHIDVKMEVGDVSSTVEVASELPLIEPDKASISYAIDNKNIKTLPLQGRQFLDLAVLTPGTVPQAPGTQAGGLSVSGMRAQSNNFTLDGISNNDPQVNGPLNAFRLADAVQEFNVQTSIATTEVGRSNGAQVSIITKSGSNNYHGSGFYYRRNNALDATPFFLNRAGQPKNPLNRHQYGGTAGGYILKDRTFWFFSYERFDEIVEQDVTARVPTAAERAQVTDPVSLAVLQFYPQENLPGASSNWAGTAATATKNDTYFWRVDQKINDRNNFSGRYAWLRGTSDQLQATASPFNGNITNAPGQHNFSLQETYATSALVNEARAGFSRNRTWFLPKDVNDVNPASIFVDAAGNPLPGYVDTSTDALNGGLPNITITGFAGMGAGTNMPQGRATNSYEFLDNVTWTSPFGWSKHTFRFGGEWRYEITNRFLNGNYRGQVTFTSWNTCGTVAAPTSCFTQGIPARGSLRTGTGGTFRTWTRSIWYFYGQDTYKVRPNLTVNYGLRWEGPGEYRERYNRGSNFVPGVGMMVLGSNLRVDIDPTLLGRNAIVLTPVSTFLRRTGQKNSDLNNFGPFLGIAWSPQGGGWLTGNGKTVIRTGFRLGYDDIFSNIPVNMGLNAPDILTTTLPTGAYSWATALNQNRSLFAADATVAGGQRGIVSFNSWAYDAATAYGMNYALEIQRELFRDYAFEIQYVGSQGRKLGAFLDQNQPTVVVNDPTRIGSSSAGPTPNQRIFPFNQYAGIFNGDFVSNSNYNGMVVAFRKRLSKGYNFSLSYTLGHALDNNSAFFGSTGEAGAYADVRNRAAEYGNSSFDIRHRIVATYLFELPFGRGRRWGSGVAGWLNQFMGGWDISGITQWRSGFPFSILAGTATDYSGFNQFVDRPFWAPGVTGLAIDYSRPENVFACQQGPATQTVPPTANCTPFVAPTAGLIGDVSRNYFRGPQNQVWDIAIFKNFQVREGQRIQFRAELFNAFNKTNFNLPSLNANFRTTSGIPQSPTNPSSSTIGTVTGSGDPRIIQLGLRFDF